MRTRAPTDGDLFRFALTLGLAVARLDDRRARLPPGIVRRPRQGGSRTTPRPREAGHRFTHGGKRRHVR